MFIESYIVLITCEKVVLQYLQAEFAYYEIENSGTSSKFFIESMQAIFEHTHACFQMAATQTNLAQGLQARKFSLNFNII